MIDVNAYLGHFAFRQLRHNTAGELLRLMDRKRIERAAVSSAAAITYRNPQAGNEELAAATKSHLDRFIPLAVINPSYAAWRDDLETCHRQLSCKGVRLYPRWHNYRLTDPACLEMTRMAAARGMVISIPLRAEDRRQQSWLVDVPDVSHNEIAELVKAVPEAYFVLLNGQGFVNSVLGRKNSGLPPNYAVDIALLTVELANEVGQLISNLGEDRVLFGTGIPFHYADPAIVKLDILEAGDAVKNKIRTGNAARIFRL